MARTGLGETTTKLVTPGEVSLPDIDKTFRDGYDVLYRMAHGRLVNGVSRSFSLRRRTALLIGSLAAAGPEAK